MQAKKGNIFFTETKQQHVPQRQIKNTYWNWCTGNKVVFCHWIVKFWAADARCPRDHSKQWSVSSVSGSTESQRVLTPETGSHLHLSMGDTPPQEGLASRVSGYPKSPQRCHLWNQETCGSGDQGQESQESVKSSGPGRGRRALPARSSVEASGLGQLVCRGPRVSFKNVITTLTLH